MHQKKRKKVIIGALLAFFVLSGLWYYVLHVQDGAGGLRADKEAKAAQDIKTAEAEKTAQGARLPESEKMEQSVLQPEQEGSSKPEQPLYVFLCGCVAKEGVYSLLPGSRLYEAVEFAGGFTEEADRTYHNLARPVADGERIYIPSKTETEGFDLTERVNSGSWQGKDISASEKGKINLNTATREELMSLSGIGEAKAEDIIEYRTKAGVFAAVEEIMNVSGIGTAMFEKIKEYITVK